MQKLNAQVQLNKRIYSKQTFKINEHIE